MSMGHALAMLFQTPGSGREGSNNWKVEPGKQDTLSKMRRGKEFSPETKKRAGEKEGA